MLIIIKERYKYIKTLIFGSRLSVYLYILHIVYGVIFKFINFIKKEKIKKNDTHEYLDKFNENGYVKIENSVSQALMDSIYNQYKKLITNENYLSKSSAKNIFRINECLIRIPDLKKILDEKIIKEFLLNYFKGDYKIYYCDAHRLFNEKNNKEKMENSSLEWHFDNLPKDLIKLMVYLVDVNKKNAAISLLDKKISTQLKIDGYWDRKSEFGKYLLEKYDVNNKSKYIEGQSGSSVFFSTHYCLHRANKPTTHDVFRDAIVFLIGPSIKKFKSESNILHDRVISNSEELKINPFF